MSDTPSVEQRVIGAIARSKRIDTDTLRAETTFEELGMDSLDAIELLFEIEEEFDLTVEDDAVQGKETVGQVIEAVHEALAAEPHTPETPTPETPTPEIAAGGDPPAEEE